LVLYTPPILDYGKRNLIEKTIDFICFGWHFIKASIYSDYLGNNVRANKELEKAGCYRKKYLFKKFEIHQDDLVLKIYKNSNIKSIIDIEKTYIFLMREGKNEVDFLHEAGEIFLSLKNWKMATKAFALSIDSNPHDVMGYYYLGLSYFSLKRLLNANQCFEKVIRIKPDFADAYYQLGIIAEKEKNLRKAQNYYEKTISILPNHLECLKALKKINRKIRD